MAVAEITNLTIYKGSDFSATFNIFDPDESVAEFFNLTTTYASIKKHPGSSSSIDFAKSITIGTGTIVLTLTAAQTAQLSEGRNYFDVLMTLNNKITPIIRGTAMVYESVSV